MLTGWDHSTWARWCDLRDAAIIPRTFLGPSWSCQAQVLWAIWPKSWHSSNIVVQILEVILAGMQLGERIVTAVALALRLRTGGQSLKVLSWFTELPGHGLVLGVLCDAFGPQMFWRLLKG